MSIKAILDHKFNKNTITSIEDSSSEEDPKIKYMEQTLAQTLENIEIRLKIILEIPQIGHRYKSEQKV